MISFPQFFKIKRPRLPLALLFLYLSFYITGCSLYESEARKFLRENGYTYSKSVKADLSLSSKRHCQKNKFALEKTGWVFQDSGGTSKVEYYDAAFSCHFWYSYPTTLQNEDYYNIWEVVNFYAEKNKIMIVEEIIVPAP